MQSFFLGGAVELPPPECGRGRHGRHGRGRDQPETEIKAHTARRSHWIMSPMIILVVLAFLAILASLGAALFFMMRAGKDTQSGGRRMARALAWRVGLSILLFVCILLAWKLGYIQPTGLPASR